MNKKHITALIFYSCILSWTPLSPIFFLDWFRSAITNAEKNIENLVKLRKRIEIQYDDTLEIIHNEQDEKIRKTLKNEILRINISFPYTTYIQKVDSDISDLVGQKETVKKYLGKVKIKTEEDKRQYETCLSLYREEKVPVKNLIDQLSLLRETVIKYFNNHYLSELIKIKELYDRTPPYDPFYYDHYHDHYHDQSYYTPYTTPPHLETKITQTDPEKKSSLPQPLPKPKETKIEPELIPKKVPSQHELPKPKEIAHEKQEVKSQQTAKITEQKEYSPMGQIFTDPDYIPTDVMMNFSSY